MTLALALALAAGAAVAGPLPSSSTIAAETDELLLQGLDALYGLDFERAEKLFDQADQLQPDHPAGPFFKSGLYWVRFSQDADLAGTSDELEPGFKKEIDEVIRRCEKLLDKDESGADARFFLGGAHGMRGRWQVLKRQWIRAAFNGYKGYKILLDLVELAPDYHDAYLGLGMYDYYSDKLPTVLKIAQFVVARGDKERGLRHIQTTIEKGHFSGIEAKLFLIGLYTGYENKPRKALELIDELRRERPDNPFFTFLEVVARIDNKDWQGAIAFGELLVPRFRAMPQAREQVGLLDLYLASAYIGNKDFEKALALLDRCIQEAHDPRRATITFCRLRRAQLLDIVGRRKDAVAEYRAVAKRPDFFDSQEKAKQGLKKPATHELIVKQLLE